MGLFTACKPLGCTAIQSIFARAFRKDLAKNYWCSLPKRQAIRDKAQTSLSAWLSQHTSPSISKLIIAGLFQWSKHQRVSGAPTSFESSFYCSTFEHQTSIGWHQLWYGRFSTWWMSLQDQHIRTHPDKYTQQKQIQKLPYHFILIV